MLGRVQNKFLQCKCYWQNSQTQMRLRYSFWGTLIFSLLAHGYAYLNYMPSHDMLNYISHFAGEWEISLGRFMQVLYQDTFRGGYAVPWLSAALTIIYSTLASMLINDLLEMRNRWIVFLSAGFMVANASMMELNASFQYASDAFALALLLSCAGAYFAIRKRSFCSMILSAVLLMTGMGFYAAYILHAVILMMASAIRAALIKRELWKKEWKTWLRYVVVLALAAVAYLLCVRLSLVWYDIDIADSYNSPSRLLSYSVAEILPFIRHAYSSFANFFLGFREQSLTSFHLANIALFVVTGITLLIVIFKKKLPVFNAVILGAGILAIPGIAQIMSILTLAHSIYFMASHALFLLYPMFLSILSNVHFVQQEGSMPAFERRTGYKWMVLALSVLLLYSNCRFSNEAYVYQDIVHDRTAARIAQMMDDVEEMPGYKAGETAVVFCGNLNLSVKDYAAPEAARWIPSLTSTAITYETTLRSFVKMMGYDVRFQDSSFIYNEPSRTAFLNDMPVYPHRGYCQSYEGLVIVRLSE